MKNKLSLNPLAAALMTLALSAGLAPAFAAAASAQPSAAPVNAIVNKSAVQRYVLKSGMADGKMVFLDAKGIASPVLKANVGDTVEIVLSSGEGAEHDFVIPELNVHSKHIDGRSGPTTLRFKVTVPGKFTQSPGSPGMHAGVKRVGGRSPRWAEDDFFGSPCTGQTFSCQGGRPSTQQSS